MKNTVAFFTLFFGICIYWLISMSIPVLIVWALLKFVGCV